MTTATLPIQAVAAINPPQPRDLSNDLQRQVGFVPMANVGEDGTLRSIETRSVGELLAGYTYFADGDVIVAKITPCLQNGKAALVSGLPGGHGFGSTEFHVLRAGPKLDKRYLFYMVWSPDFRRFGEQRFTGSAGQKRMPASAVAEFGIPIPFPDDPRRSLAEQKRIAAILDKADAIRRRRQEAARLADTLIPSVFYEMFGRTNAELRRWPMSPLGTFIVEGPQNGLYRPSTEYGSGTRIVRIDSFYQGELCHLDKLKRVRLEDDTIQKWLLRRDDLLINRVNSTEFLGKSAIVPEHDEPMVFESNMMRFRVDADQLAPRFLIAMLQTRLIKGQILKKERPAVNQSSINQDDVKALMIPTPPILLQRDFAERVPAMQRQRDAQPPRAESADTLFNSLVQRAFRGEL